MRAVLVEHVLGDLAAAISRARSNSESGSGSASDMNAKRPNDVAMPKPNRRERRPNGACSRGKERTPERGAVVVTGASGGVSREIAGSAPAAKVVTRHVPPAGWGAVTQMYRAGANVSETVVGRRSLANPALRNERAPAVQKPWHGNDRARGGKGWNA